MRLYLNLHMRSSKVQILSPEAVSWGFVLLSLSSQVKLSFDVQELQTNCEITDAALERFLVLVGKR
jgi:hypothetical protein